MTEEKNLFHDATQTSTEKRAWRAPQIEALDVTSTEAAYGTPGTVEFATYTT